MNSKTEINKSEDSELLEPPQKQSILPRLYSYLKYWVKFQFFFKNRTIQQSVYEIIDEMSMFGERKIKEEEKKMLHDLIDFYDLTIEEIKIPRNEILAVEENNLDKVFELMADHKSSRIPVYRENLDNIIGFLTVKDLFIFFKENGSLQNAHELIRKILFAPPSMKALDLLLKMKKTKIHIAAIIDEYGGTDGIITINSIISEIVGTINEESEEEEINQIGPNQFEVSGRAEIDELKEKLNIDLFTEEYKDIETINGLILSICNYVPEINTTIDLPNNFICTIQEANDRMVIKALISKKKKEEEIKEIN